MLDSSVIVAALRHLPPEQWRAALAGFLPKNASGAEKIEAIETSLRSPAGQALRESMAQWIVDDIVPVSRLVPKSYLKWRAPVREAMTYVVAHLSPARLAPKLLEQIELPASTAPEKRLLRLIAKVPGLQKLGQVIARNQHLRPALRAALARLENGIRDVGVEDIQAIVRRDLGLKYQSYRVEIAPAILSEASVSAVVRFYWRNPQSGKRERGVFKVLKSYIPEYFAEDMHYLQGLAKYFGESHPHQGFSAGVIPDTFLKVRRLLKHEVDFVREQKTLVEAFDLYRSMHGVRVPRLIPELCTPRITAMTEERGIKITSAAVRAPAALRRKMTEQLVEALVAVPLLSSRTEAIFHGDPHAGNLLYNSRTGELVIVDWALRERLSREHRRHLALLFFMLSLRDPVGTCNAVLALTQPSVRKASLQGVVVRDVVAEFIDQLPVRHVPSAVDSMRLLERIALRGIKFPGTLIMLSKGIFTLDGVVGDIDNSNSGMGFAIARHIAQHWLSNWSEFRSPLATKDWVALQCSALLYPSRLWLQCEGALLNRLLPPEVRASPS